MSWVDSIFTFLYFYQYFEGLHYFTYIFYSSPKKLHSFNETNWRGHTR